MDKIDLPLDLYRAAPQILEARVQEHEDTYWLAVYTLNGLTALREELEAETYKDAQTEAYALLAAWVGFDEEVLELLGVQL